MSQDIIGSVTRIRSARLSVGWSGGLSVLKGQEVTLPSSHRKSTNRATFSEHPVQTYLLIISLGRLFIYSLVSETGAKSSTNFLLLFLLSFLICRFDFCLFMHLFKYTFLLSYNLSFSNISRLCRNNCITYLFPCNINVSICFQNNLWRSLRA